jgi:hypothetical protein
MGRIRILTAAAVVTATLLVGLAPTAASAAPTEDTRTPTSIVGGSFILDPAPTYYFTPFFIMKFQAELRGPSNPAGHDIFFTAAGVPICHAVTDGYGRAQCSILSGGLGSVMAIATLQATAEYRGNALYQPSSATLPAIGPSLAPIFIG